VTWSSPLRSCAEKCPFFELPGLFVSTKLKFYCRALSRNPLSFTRRIAYPVYTPKNIRRARGSQRAQRTRVRKVFRTGRNPVDPPAGDQPRASGKQTKAAFVWPSLQSSSFKAHQHPFVVAHTRTGRCEIFRAKESDLPGFRDIALDLPNEDKPPRRQNTGPCRLSIRSLKIPYLQRQLDR
jgi:hypothetical protein